MRPALRFAPVSGAIPTRLRVAAFYLVNLGVAQLALVDFLFVRVAQRLYDRTTQNLRATYEAVQPHRLGYDRRPRP